MAVACVEQNVDFDDVFSLLADCVVLPLVEEADVGVTGIPNVFRPLPALTVSRPSDVVVQTVLLEDVRRLSEERFNTTNHHDWAPFMGFGEVAVVDSTWWSSLSPQQRELIEAAVEVRAADEPVAVPHEVLPPSASVYQAYIAGFDFARWRALRPDALLVPLSAVDRLSLEQVARRYALGGSKPEANDFDEISGALRSALEDAIQHVGGRAFAKTAEKSAKNDVPLRPHETANSILLELVSSPDVLYQSLGTGGTGNRKTAQYLVVQPWDDRIRRRNEFRVIVSGSNVVGITQQCWSAFVGHSSASASSYVAPILDLWYERLQSRCPYADCVLDVFVAEHAHLIEINPCGLWGSSGSGLFHWLRDREALCGGPLPLRVVVETRDETTMDMDW